VEKYHRVLVLEELPAVGQVSLCRRLWYCCFPGRHSYSSFDVPLELTNGKMVQTEKRIFPKKYGMTYTYK
jgi:hypothetical protein